MTCRPKLFHVADVRDEHHRNGKPAAPLRLTFDNSTEATRLMSSLVRRLYEDKDARRIGSAAAGPLFEGARTEIVYVPRSLSDEPEVQGLLKAGTTSGFVEDRIAHEQTQSTFLLVPVTVGETYELTYHFVKEAEQRIHRAFRPYNIALRVTGLDEGSFSATEWFKASPKIVEAVIRKALA